MSLELQLGSGLQALGLDLPVAAQAKLLDYLALLGKWNRTFRLTAVDDPRRAVSLHLLDSLAILPFVGGGPLLDVGSGAGLPGIPLAIARPDLRVVVLDSSSKKAAFLRQVVIEQRLPNVGVHCGRVEAYHPADGFAVIVARAFSELGALVERSRHLLGNDGCWLALKGARPADEVARLPGDVQLAGVHRLNVPGVDGQRHVLVISRTGWRR